MTAAGNRTEPAPENWLDLEKLATRIYEELEPESRVEHNARIRGQLTETDRQIDVLIENERLGTRVVVDCKDHARPVNAPAAASFAGLLEDVEATSGVLICNRGFSKATRTYARKKGFALARLHDVSSRKWNLDVLLPVVWTTLRLTDLGIGARVYMEKGNAISTESPPRFSKDGEPVEIAQVFEEIWNGGGLHLGKAGRGRFDVVLDMEIEDGVVLPGADVQITYEVGGASRLGYVTPQQARGIFDEETQAFSTVHLDVGETVSQEPEGGWEEIFDPDDVAVSLKGTVISLQETVGVTVELSGISEIQGAEPATQAFRWRRDQQRSAQGA